MSIDWDDVVKMYGEGYGTSRIGEKYGVQANSVRRGLIKLGIKMRTQSESQKLQLDKGLIQHPTKGKERSSETKDKIAKTSHATYEALSENDKKVIKERSRKAWDNRSPELVSEMQSKSAQGIRKASKEGSKLERFLVDKISELGREVIWHASDFLENTELEVDLLLPKDKIAIEVDGVFHFQAVFSDEQYQKTVRADTEKNGLLLKNGYCVIRIRNTKKNVSNLLHENLWEELKPLIQKINMKFPSVTNRTFELEIK